MKKLIAIWFLMFFTVIGNAQMNTKPKLSELSQDQLQHALTKSKKTVRTGKTLTFIGLGASSVGLIMFSVELGKEVTSGNSNLNTGIAGGIIMGIGSVTILIGIPVWIVGAIKKDNIELELVKFNSKGSASINGVGIKIRF